MSLLSDSKCHPKRSKLNLSGNYEGIPPSYVAFSEDLKLFFAGAKTFIDEFNAMISEPIKKGFVIESEQEDDKENCEANFQDLSSVPLYHKENCKAKFEGLSSCIGKNREEYQNELVNLEMGKHDANVLKILKMFRDKYVRALENKRGNTSKGAHAEAGEVIKKMGMCNFVKKPFGHIPGIEISDAFRFRAELVVVGLHDQFVSGISYLRVNGKICATSVVESGQYENKKKMDGVLIYSGQGGNPKLKGEASDQKLERGNLALVNSMEMGYPVRVIFKRRNVRTFATFRASTVYVYDGLYYVNNCLQKRGEHGKSVFKFELRRLSSQPRPRENILSKTIERMDACVLNDVSQGKEKFPIRVMNGVDDEIPLPFTYMTKIVYPQWFKHIEPIGCNCIDGCSNLKQCRCASKNVDDISFTEDGAILGAKHVVHECGPSCKCPPWCMNRINRPCYQLEIFKTKSRGWGVRSRNYISKGSFVCEYIGELLRVKKVQHRTGNDKHIFHIWKGHYEKGPWLEKFGFALDSTMYGNIGRFVNHSCSPNLIAKEVLNDHDDKRVPHIMFFASMNIGPFQELTCNH